MSTLALDRPRLNPVRITALSTALALHAAAFGLLVLPASPLLAALEPPPAAIVIDFIAAVVPPPPIPVPPVPPPPTRPTPRTLTPVVKPVVIAESDFEIVAPVLEPVTETTSETVTDAAPTPTTAAAIAYADVPAPPYPRAAIRERLEGEVLLRVRVDESGRPVDVEVERSSGHRVLDRTAREHVLKRWRFQPAMVAGQAVAAWALVPVNFRLANG